MIDDRESTEDVGTPRRGLDAQRRAAFVVAGGETEAMRAERERRVAAQIDAFLAGEDRFL